VLDRTCVRFEWRSDALVDVSSLLLQRRVLKAFAGGPAILEPSAFVPIRAEPPCLSADSFRRSVDPLAAFSDAPDMKPLDLPLAEMTAREKLRAIETIWADCRATSGRYHHPAGILMS
jgi:hypothetical protein